MIGLVTFATFWNGRYYFCFVFLVQQCVLAWRGCMKFKEEEKTFFFLPKTLKQRGYQFLSREFKEEPLQLEVSF